MNKQRIMNIGMILDKPYPPDPRVENEASYLAEQGFNVHLYCFTFDSKTPKHWEHKGFTVHNYPMPSWLSKAYALAYTLPFYHWYLKRSIRQFILDFSITHLHVHDMQVARTLFWLNKELNLPLVLDLHENRPEIMKAYEHVNSFLGKLSIYPRWWKRFEYDQIKEADAVIVVTKEAADYYVDQIPINKDKFIIVPNTVKKAFYDDQHHEPLAGIDTLCKLLYIGDTGSRRGLLTAFKAIQYLKHQGLPVILDVVGSSKFDASLQKNIAALNIQNEVHLHGWQDFTRFPSFIKACHVGICPLHRNLHHDTTYANKIFQYMSFAKPIIVSDSTAQKNVVEKYKVGGVFPAKDFKAMALCIEALIKDPDKYKQLSANASNAIQSDLHWEKTALALRNHYNTEKVKLTSATS